MQNPCIVWTAALCAGFVGVTLGILARRLPKRGIVAVVVVILAMAPLPFIDRSDISPVPAYLPLLSFMLLAPISTLYSIWSLRNAPTSVFAMVAFTVVIIL